MSKIYVVTEGSYSDYRIVAIFAQRKLALAYVAVEYAAHKYCDARVETHNVLEVLPERIQWYDAKEYANGQIEHSEYGMWEYEKKPVPVRVHKGAYNGKGLYIEGTDKALVEKAFHDRMAQHKAEEEGIV